MDIATLKNADLVSLSGAQLAYAQLVTSFGQHIDDWRSQVVNPLGSWSGSTAVQVHGDLAVFNGKLQAAHDELNMISATLDDAERSFALAQAKLIQALDDAQAAKITINPDGGMTWDSQPGAPSQADQAQGARAADIRSRINEALAEAAQADQLISSRLKHFTDNATSGKGLDTATAGADQQTENNRENIPKQGSDPKQVKAWWDSLTPQEQHELINNHPQDIGNLDGIPSADRDQANRIGLTQIRTSLQAQIDGLGPEPPMFDGLVSGGFPVQTEAYTEWKKKHDALQGQLDSFTHIQDRLNGDDAAFAKDPSSHPRDYLLGIGTQGQGRAILSFGNPDTARDVTSYVPGMTSNLDSLGTQGQGSPGDNEADNALNLYNATEAAKNHPGSTASIVWLGYDAPPGVTQAGSNADANAGAPAYANFLTGLRATNEGPQPQHLTSVGHSYGSLLVGTATLQANHSNGQYTKPDDVVFIGSPGTGAQKASDFGLPPGHVWVGEARNDIVTHTPGFSFNPDQAWFGMDPASSDFGAHRFTVADGSVLDPIKDHTSYMDRDGGPSLNNIANIAAGNPSGVQTEQPR